MEASEETRTARTGMTDGELLDYCGDDGQRWAQQFVETVRQNPAIPLDVGTMTGWFANAIEAAQTARERRRREADGEPVAELRVLRAGEVAVHRSDLLKATDALRHAARHHQYRDTANAELHLAETTRFSPLTSELIASQERMELILRESEARAEPPG